MINVYTCDFQRKMIQNNLLSKKPTQANENILIENITSVITTSIVEQWRKFFLTDFSIGFLSRISYDLYGTTWQYIQGEYYLFISPVGGEKSIPYYKVSLFSRQKDAMLKSYLSVITSRYFYDKKLRESKVSNASSSIDEVTRLKINFSGNEVIENPWYALLIYDGDADLLSADNYVLMAKLKKMIEKLPQKEQTVIQMSVYEDYSGEEIFEELLSEGLIQPKRDVSTLTSKDKQDAVANIKKRALSHLKTLMKE